MSHVERRVQVQEEDVQADDLAERELEANELPFFLRAWWMKDYAESADLQFQQDQTVTFPLGALHSDPFCDAGCIDYTVN